MSLLHRVGLAMFAAVSAACVVDGILGGTSTEASGQAVVTYQCGPAGGVDGVAIYLALGSAPLTSREDIKPPYAFVTIPELPDRLTPGSWAVGDGGEARAVHRPDSDRYETASAGTVTVDGVDVDWRIVGSVDLEFSTAGRVTTDFEAVWEDVYCI